MSLLVLCMARANMLFELPSDPASVVLTFLSLPDLLAVDLASTSSKHRKSLFSTYSTFTFVQPVVVKGVETLQWFVNRCIRVHHIVVRKMSSASVLSGVVNCIGANNLHTQTLDFQGNHALTNNHLRAVFDVRNDGISSKELRKVVLTRCAVIDDEALQLLGVGWSSPSPNSKQGSPTALASTCPGPHLTSILVAHCPLITPSGITSLAQFHADTLHTLDISGISNVSDSSIEKIVFACGPRLKCLSMNKCIHVTDEALRLIAQWNPRLEELGLQFCRRVTDAGVALLVSGCSMLKVLNLSDCMNITDTSVLCIAKNCRQLMELNLLSCLNISKHPILALKKALPQLVLRSE